MKIKIIDHHRSIMDYQKPLLTDLSKDSFSTSKKTANIEIPKASFLKNVAVSSVGKGNQLKLITGQKVF